MTLIEVVMALAILSMALMGILAVQMQSRRLTEGSVYQNTALTIVQGYLEQMKNIDLNSLLNADSNGNPRISTSYTLPTKYSDTVTDTIKTSTGTPPAINTLTPGVTPTGAQDNLKGFDMAKDLTDTSMTSTDTTYYDVTQQVAWSTIWPGATDYTTASEFGLSSTTVGRTDLHLNLWVWITDLSGTSTYAKYTYGITIIYTWQFLDGKTIRYAMGTVRTIRSNVPSF
jgi:Tfp pilus assembly protein PilV